MSILLIALTAIFSSLITGLVLYKINIINFIHDKRRDEIFPYIAETIQEAYFILSSDCKKIIYMSPAYEKIYGKSIDDLYKSPISWFDVVHPDDKEFIKLKTKEFVKKGLFDGFPDYRIYRPDGSFRWIATRAFPMKDKGGKILRIAGFAEDITERKIAEIEQKKREELYRSIINNTQDVIYRTDINDNILMVSPSAYKLLGYEPDFNFIGLNLVENAYYSSKEREAFMAILKEKGEVTDYEVSLKKRDGSLVVVSTSSQLYYDDNGNVAGVEGVVRDITDRKRAEELFNKAFYENPCNMTISDFATRKIIDANNSWLQTMEYTRDEVVGYTVQELKIYRSEEDLDLVRNTVLKNGRAANLEIDFVSKNGKIQKALFFTEIVEVGETKIILSSGINLTELRAAEKSLSESEEKFRRLAENAPDIIYRMKLPEGVYEYMSPSSKKVLGYSPEEFYSKPMLIEQIIHPDWADNFRKEWNKILKGKVSPYYEYKIISHEGDEKWLHQRNVIINDENGNPAWLEGIITDLTEKKLIAEDLILKNAILSAEQEASLDGILNIDQNAKIISINKRFIEVWRMPEELISAGDEKEMMRYALSQVNEPKEFLKKVTYLFEHIDEKSNDEIVFKDGRIIEMYSAPVKTADGIYPARVWYFRDITYRKLAEYNLRKSEEKFRRLTESAPIGIFLTDSVGRVTYTNPAWQKLAGLSFEESLGLSWTERIHNEDRERVVKEWTKAISAQRIGSSKFRFMHTDGTVNISYTIAVPVFDDKGKLICFVGTNDDVTEREQVQDKLKNLNEELTSANEELTATNEEFEAQNEELIASNYEIEHAQKMLMESEKGYRALVENFSAGVIVFDSDRRIILINPNASKIAEMPNENMLGLKSDHQGFVGFMVWYENGSLVNFDDFPVQIVLSTGKSVKNMVFGLSRNNQKITKWVLCDAYPEYNPAGSIIKVIVTLIDITERKMAEEEILTLKNYMNNIIDSIPDMLVGLDPDMNITLINRKTEKTSGISMEEAMGKPVHLVLEDFAPVIMNMKNGLRDRHAYSVPDYLLEKNGDKRYYNLMLSPLIDNGIEGAVVRIEDVTDIRRMDDQLKQAQKMETVGNLAGGLAHDFNNVLSGIVGTVSLIKHLMTKESLLNEKFMNYIEIIERSGKRAAEMVQQLLTISRRYEVTMRSVDLNTLLKNVMQICNNTFDKSIEIIAEFNSGDAMIDGDPSQIEQVILNLCINASHAMTIMRSPDERYGGILTVSIRHIRADRYFCSIHPEAKEGQYWMISHSDTGVGMDDDVMRSIFDPFFTTKDHDQGTGLGLAMVYSIIHHHNGFIDVYSEKGIGSSFNVYLPESSESEHSDHLSSEPLAVKGEGTILVIDDEEIVRLMAENILRECGYNVISADNGRDGIEIFRKQSDLIKAVLLDMAMPGLSGKEVFIELKKIYPEVKVLLASGFRQDYRVEEALKLGITSFIQKPYSLGELSKKMQEINSD